MAPDISVAPEAENDEFIDGPPPYQECLPRAHFSLDSIEERERCKQQLSDRRKTKFCKYFSLLSLTILLLIGAT